MNSMVAAFHTFEVDPPVLSPGIDVMRRFAIVIVAVGVILTGFSRADAEEAVDAKLQLGRILFFDARLSGDASLACSDCHRPELAYTDGLPLSAGYPSTEYFRNTPTLLNVAHRRWIYWDGRLSGRDLPTVVRDHLSESHFMNIDGRLLIERLRQVPEYRDLFQSAFGGPVSYGRILDSLAAFVTSLEAADTPFDRFRAGDMSAISEQASRGWDLFQDKAGCIDCHSGDDLSDESFHDLGLEANLSLFQSPERHYTFRRFLRTLGVADYDAARLDPGLGAITKLPADQGRFRTPSLRFVAHTAPYMHDGQFSTLEEVVAFYNRGGGTRGGVADLEPLDLTEDEQAALIAFLNTLGGDWPIVEAVASPEYDVRPLPAGGDIAADDLPRVSVETPQSDVPLLAALPEVPIPGDNPATADKSELGRLLFFDPRLSGDGSTSCATCHDPQAGWGDGQSLSLGYPGTEHWRNSQTCVNTGYITRLFWAGESTSLESQAAAAIEGNLAGNVDGAMVEERLKQIPEYVERFERAFGADEPSYPLALKALATFQRVELVSDNSPFDAYMRGDESALDESQRRGLELFQSKANCIRCHNGALLTDESYHNLGIPSQPLFEEQPLYQISLRYQHAIRGVSQAEFDGAHTDLGVYYATLRDSDRGRFRTPPLRYLRYTAPYMHNGVFATLREVIDFYDQDGGDDPNRSPLIEPLGLNDQEKGDLEAFLLSLSGSEIIIEAPELPPYDVWQGFGDEAGSTRP